MKPELYQLAARVLFFFEYRRTREFIRRNIGHAVRYPEGGIAYDVAAASHHLRIQFGK